MAHSQQTNGGPGKVVVEHIHFEHIVDDVPTPPPHLTSKFKTIQDWLSNICDKDKPKKPIAEYKLGFFESLNDYTLFLFGVNTYAVGKNRSRTRIEFKPSNMYFKLPGTEYENLNREQLLDKLTSQFKAFANTEKFKTSFLTKANTVIFESNGEAIWSK